MTMIMNFENSSARIEEENERISALARSARAKLTQKTSCRHPCTFCSKLPQAFCVAPTAPVLCCLHNHHTTPHLAHTQQA